MGLGISAYSNLIEKPKVKCIDGEFYEARGDEIVELERESLINVWEHDDFPGRLSGLNQEVYEYNEDNTMGFHVGAYSSYNWWRELLAEMAGYSAKDRDVHGKTESRHDQGAWEAESGPFWELICFSDCEGFIGPEASAKLAAEFAAPDNLAKAQAMEERMNGFMRAYRNFQQAFELAAKGGVVQFH